MTEQEQKEQEQKEQEQKEIDRLAREKSEQQRGTMIPKSRFDEVNARKKEAEAELASVAESLKEEIPEEMRELIPDLPPAALIKWLRAATAKGIFSKAPPESGPDGGRRPNTKQPQDLTGMSPVSMMSMGYAKK